MSHLNIPDVSDTAVLREILHTQHTFLNVYKNLNKPLSSPLNIYMKLIQTKQYLSHRINLLTKSINSRFNKIFKKYIEICED